MLTIHQSNKIVGQTIQTNDGSSYQIEWCVEYNGHYRIGLSCPFKGIQKNLMLYREASMYGPLSNDGYYKLEDDSTLNHILCSKPNLNSIGTFLIDIKFLLEMQSNPF